MAGKIVVRETATGVVEVVAAGPQGIQGPVGPQGPQGDPGVVQSVVAGSGVSVDSTDAANPIVTADVTQAEVDAKADQVALDAHVSDTGNPHAVTAAQAGAAAITAEDATTGRLALNGAEVGDTGWRNVGADLLNGWTTGTEGVMFRRVGGLVTLIGNPSGGAATSILLYTLPSGFLAPVWQSTVAVTGTNPMTSPTVHQWRIRRTGEVEAPQVDNLRLTLTWTTDDPWPSTLPGTAA